MAAPRRKPPPPPWWRVKLESRAVQAAALLTIFSLFSFLFGTVRDLGLTAWRHYTGAELAHELAPEVQAARTLAQEAAALAKATVERADVGERRLKVAEKRLDEAEETKRLEQERTGAVEKAQRSACITGELSDDACHRLGYPTEQK